MDVRLLFLLTIILIFSFGKCDNITTNNYDTIVVGLGASGVKAASELARAGRRVLALEAQDRVGGRVRTVQFGDGLLELGAEWIYGERPSDVFDTARKNNISILLDLDAMYGYLSDGSQIDPELFEELTSLSSETDGGVEQIGKSKGQYLTEQFMEHIRTKRPQLLNDTDMIESYLQFMDLAVNSIEATNDWHDPSAYSESQDLEGYKTWSWHRHGYKTYFELVLNTYNNGPGIPNLEMKLSTEVTEISWADTLAPVRVTCRDGTVYTASNVIFTGSVGVLKERYTTLFKPALPQSKIDAINKIPIGVLDKVVVSFAEPWWPQAMMFGFIWRAQDLKNVPKEDYWTTKIFTAGRPKPNGNALTIWTSGENAKLVENLPEDLVKRKVTEVLRKFMGVNSTVPEPTAIIRSSWYSNPFTRGSYTYDTVDMVLHPGSRQELAAPLLDASGKPRVLFAGEASHVQYFGTVHGAAATGSREAERLLSIIN